MRTNFSTLNVGFTALLTVIPPAPFGILRDPEFNSPSSPTTWQTTSAGFDILTLGLLTGDGSGTPFFYQMQANYLTPMVPGNYRLQFFISRITGGSVRAVFNNLMVDQTFTTTGLKTIDFTYTSGNYTFNFQGMTFNGDIAWAQIIPL